MSAVLKFCWGVRIRKKFLKRLFSKVKIKKKVKKHSQPTR